MRTRQLRQLAPALLRSVRWQPTLAGAGIAAVVLGVRRDHLGHPAQSLTVLRVVALLLALGVAFALDDRSRRTVQSVPSPAWWRAAWQASVALAPAVAAWVAALSWVSTRTGDLPVLGLSLEAAALVALGLALAAGLVRWRDLVDPGTVAGPVLLVSALMIAQLPERFALMVRPGPGWTAAHLRWSALLAVAVAVTVLAVRDPAARSPLRHPHPR
jgi:fluoroquinolone transport system permease protein